MLSLSFFFTGSQADERQHHKSHRDKWMRQLLTRYYCIAVLGRIIRNAYMKIFLRLMIVAKQIGCELWVSVYKHYWFLAGHKMTSGTLCLSLGTAVILGKRQHTKYFMSVLVRWQTQWERHSRVAKSSHSLHRSLKTLTVTWCGSCEY